MTEKEKYLKHCMESHAESMKKFQEKAIEIYKDTQCIKDYAEGYIDGIKCMMSAFEYYISLSEGWFIDETKK